MIEQKLSNINKTIVVSLYDVTPKPFLDHTQLRNNQNITSKLKARTVGNIEIVKIYEHYPNSKSSPFWKRQKDPKIRLRLKSEN